MISMSGPSVSPALEVQRREFAQPHRRSRRPGVGRHFGGSRFFDLHAYGNTINTAARLEAANKVLGTAFASAPRSPMLPKSSGAAGWRRLRNIAWSWSLECVATTS